MSNDLIDSVPAAVGGRIEGEYENAEEAHFLDPGDGVLGEVSCYVAAPDSNRDPGDLEQIVLRTLLTHYEFDDDGERAAELRGKSTADLREWEEGRTDSQENGYVIDWKPVSTGDGGVAAISEAVGMHIGDPDAIGTVSYSAVNVGMSITFHIYGRFDESEELDHLTDLARQVDRVLSTEGERAQRPSV